MNTNKITINNIENIVENVVKSLVYLFNIFV